MIDVKIILLMVLISIMGFLYIMYAKRISKIDTNELVQNLVGAVPVDKTEISLKFNHTSDVCIFKKDSTIPSHRAFQFLEFAQFIIAIKTNGDIFFNYVDFTPNHVNILFEHKRLVSILVINPNDDSKIINRDFFNVNKSISGYNEMFLKNFILIVDSNLNLFKIHGECVLSSKLDGLVVDWTQTERNEIMYNEIENEKEVGIIDSLEPSAPPNPYTFNPVVLPDIPEDKLKNCFIKRDDVRNTIFIKKLEPKGFLGRIRNMNIF